MAIFARLAAAYFAFAISGLAFACSSIPTTPDEIASAPAVSIGEVVEEQVQESARDEEFHRSRTAIVQVTQKLKGAMPTRVRVSVSCGDNYAPVGSRVVVAMMEPGVFTLNLAAGGFEQSVRQKLRLAR